MTPRAKPRPPVDIVESEKAAAAYDSAIEAWGEGLYNQLARVCRWTVAMGNKVTCPPPTPPLKPG